MTIIIVGGGGAGKTTLLVEVLVPLLRTYWRPEHVLLRAPSNKAARLLGMDAKTMHSAQSLSPESSMRTAALSLKPQAQKSVGKIHEYAGAMHCDEFSQLQGELNHAYALRTTYSRATAHGLNCSDYALPTDRFGRIAYLGYSGDELQMPPVPATSSMVRPLVLQ